MNFGTKFGNEKLKSAGVEAIAELKDVLDQQNKNILILQNHLIQVQENQVEFEKYLKDILAHVKK
jgi:hypothetical protein